LQSIAEQTRHQAVIRIEIHCQDIKASFAGIAQAALSSTAHPRSDGGRDTKL
jgi:hypothetical protein